MINKKYHDDATLLIGQGAILKIDAIPTGIATFDQALGCGGFPEGRIGELFGGESSGKTTTCLCIVASCQKHYFPKKQRNGVAAFIDAEHALDIEWAKTLGVDIDNLLLSQPSSGEQALQIATDLVESGLVDLVVVDSVAALVPQAELEGELTDAHIGVQARMMSKGLRTLSSKCSKSKTSMLFINQVREKIGVMFGNPEVTPGGRALKFYSSVRMSVSKGSAITEGGKDNVIGFNPTIKIIKNKVAPPFKSASYELYTDKSKRGIIGPDRVASLIAVAEGAGIVLRKSSSYSYNDQVMGNGIANAAKFLEDNPKMMEEIRNNVYSRLKAAATIPVKDTDDEDIDFEEETDDDQTPDQKLSKLESSILDDDDE